MDYAMYFEKPTSANETEITPMKFSQSLLIAALSGAIFGLGHFVGLKVVKGIIRSGSLN